VLFLFSFGYVLALFFNGRISGVYFGPEGMFSMLGTDTESAILPYAVHLPFLRLPSKTEVELTGVVVPRAIGGGTSFSETVPPLPLGIVGYLAFLWCLLRHKIKIQPNQFIQPMRLRVTGSAIRRPRMADEAVSQDHANLRHVLDPEASFSRCRPAIKAGLLGASDSAAACRAVFVFDADQSHHFDVFSFGFHVCVSGTFPKMLFS